MHLTEWSNKVVPLLEELTLNVDLYGDQAEGQELLMYLIGWMNSFTHYAPVLTPEQVEIVLNGLVQRLEAVCNLERKVHPDWLTFGPGWQPTSSMKDLISLLKKRKQMNPVDPSQLPGDRSF